MFVKVRKSVSTKPIRSQQATSHFAFGRAGKVKAGASVFQQEADRQAGRAGSSGEEAAEMA